MPYEPKQFTIVDPRQLDGNPYEVAAKSVEQAQGMAKLYLSTLHGAALMARNAELERQLYATGECNPAAFTDGPHGRRFADMIAHAEKHIKTLAILTTAAGYNPKAPLRG